MIRNTIEKVCGETGRFFSDRYPVSTKKPYKSYQHLKFNNFDEFCKGQRRRVPLV